MDVSDFMGAGDFLKAADLGNKTPQCTVKAVHTREFTDEIKGQHQKLVLEFHNKDKMVVLNVTNTRAMASAFGTESNAWIGKSVILSVRQTQMGPGIGVTPLNPEEPALEQQKQDTAASADDFDDDIPF